MRQTEIVGSNSFHVTDIDHSTLILAAILLIPPHAFLLAHIFKFEIGVGLSNILLQNIMEKLQVILGISLGAITLHHFGLARRVKLIWAKAVSVGVVTFVVSALTVFFVTRTSKENLYAKVIHHCFVVAEETQCREVVEKLSPQERENIAQKSEAFKKHLTNRIH